MSDLISREALMQILNSKATKNEVRELSTTYTLKELAYIIYTLPAVCDVDKVVEQIRTTGICGRCLNRQSPIEICATFCDTGKKLEIIKAGGENAT